VWGEPTKNGKEIFGFASPLQSYPQSPLPLGRGGVQLQYLQISSLQNQGLKFTN